MCHRNPQKDEETPAEEPSVVSADDESVSSEEDEPHDDSEDRRQINGSVAY